MCLRPKTEGVVAVAMAVLDSTACISMVDCGATKVAHYHGYSKACAIRGRVSLLDGC